MKEKNFSEYATNKIGKITAPRKTQKDEPRVKKTVGDDLRVRKGK